MIINYQALIDKAMHSVLRRALEQISKCQNSLDDDSSFFVSFLTNYPGVVLSQKLRDQYPEEMMVIMQYQFDDLKVEENKFSVVLYFNDIPEFISIPYDSVTSYIDKEANFALSFNVDLPYTDDTEPSADSQNTLDQSSSDSNVIFLDKFRK
jgi:hypothetical protein